GAGPDELYPAISLEVGRVYGLPQVEMVRYEGDGTATVIGAAGDHPFAAGTTWTLDGPSIMEAGLRAGPPPRHGHDTALPGTTPPPARAGSRRSRGRPASGQRSARRSWSAARSGERSSLFRAPPNPFPRARRGASASSPSWSRPPSRTSKRETSCAVSPTSK